MKDIDCVCAKERLSIVLDVLKGIFHIGYIPFILYLGYRKGANPGMPELSLMSLLWSSPAAC